ncbi:MAG: Fur family transcriptional regulator [Polyangiales bacterium]
MTLSKSDVKAMLRAAGLRATGPRLAVVSLLGNSGRPLSCSEVIRGLGQVDWDSATVYRNLTRLTESGLARIVSRADGMARYELAHSAQGATHAHPHFLCTECGAVSCLNIPEIRLPQIPEPWRASVQHATLQLQGRCPDCL